MNGSKRKSGPIKDDHKKHNKKPKTDPSLKSALKKGNVKSVPAKEVEKSSDSDSEDSESDGGAALQSVNGEGAEDSDVTENSDSEEIPKVEDGVHPERAKAAAVNSRIFGTH